jgi:hypothetical protein
MRISSLMIAVVVTTACGGSTPMEPSRQEPPAMPAPSPAATPAPTPDPMPNPGPTVLRSAQIGGANGHSASGTAEILQDGTTFSLRFKGNFRIDSGNNDVYLTSDPGGITGSDLNLGPLRETSGAQSYTMPHDGGAYRYVMLWCRPFRVPIGVGELR